MSKFKDQLEKARNEFDKIINLKVFILFFLAVIFILFITGDWIGGISTFVLFLFYRYLINRYKRQIMEIKNNG